MHEWLASLDPDAMIGLAGAIGLGLAAIGAMWRGYKKGQPTSAAVAAAIEAQSCRAIDMEPAFRRVREDIAALHADVEKVNALVIRIEDRTRQ